jgi:hypothetical protein
MQESLSHSAPYSHSHGDFDDLPDDERLRGLTHQQLEDRLRWLSWWAPGAFVAVMDYMEFTDALAADTARPAG